MTQQCSQDAVRMIDKRTPSLVKVYIVSVCHETQQFVQGRGM